MTTRIDKATEKFLSGYNCVQTVVTILEKMTKGQQTPKRPG